MRSSALICPAAAAAVVMAAALMAQAQAVAPSHGKSQGGQEQPSPPEVSALVVHPPHMVSSVEVTPTGKCLKGSRPPDAEVPPAKLIDTFPANGAVVRPGVVVVRMTFDLPMACIGLLDRHEPLSNPCPSPLQEPMISRDRRTFLTVCVLAPGSHYGLWLRNFISLAGHRAAVRELVFDTSSAPKVASVPEALLEDPWLRPLAPSASSPEAQAPNR